MNVGGFIKLHRAALDSWLWTLPAEQLKVAITLLLLVNWRPGSVMSGGRKVEIPRGSTMTSLEALAKLSGVSIRTVRSALHNLENAGFSTRQTTNRHTVISIVNFDTYQDRDEAIDTQIDKPATSQRQASDKPATTIEEVKKERREEEHIQPPPEGAGVSAGEQQGNRAAGRAVFTERAKNEGYSQILVSWINSERRRLGYSTPGTTPYSHQTAATLKHVARLRKGGFSAEDALAGCKLRLQQLQAIGEDRARQWLTPGTMLNSKLPEFIEQARAGHSYQAAERAPTKLAPAGVQYRVIDEATKPNREHIAIAAAGFAEILRMQEHCE